MKAKVLTAVLGLVFGILIGIFGNKFCQQSRDLRAYDNKARIDSLSVQAQRSIQLYKATLQAFEENISTGKPLVYTNVKKQQYEVTLKLTEQIKK